MVQKVARKCELEMLIDYFVPHSTRRDCYSCVCVHTHSCNVSDESGTASIQLCVHSCVHQGTQLYPVLEY
jgi:hypothetical protein